MLLPPVSSLLIRNLSGKRTTLLNLVCRMMSDYVTFAHTYSTHINDETAEPPHISNPNLACGYGHVCIPVTALKRLESRQLDLGLPWPGCLKVYSSISLWKHCACFLCISLIFFYCIKECGETKHLGPPWFSTGYVHIYIIIPSLMWHLCRSRLDR